ncbi:MAG: penicillin-binding protein 2, partial [Deltaproteobacteria bacterium]|nr:penicillin-binding protein 2 [Deltaproteobacteria bacterium]
MADYLKGIDSEWFRHRLSLAVLVALVAFVVITGRLFHLQIVEGETYRMLSETNSIRLQTVEPQRGLIFDRNGELLVDNRPSFDVTVIPRDARPVPVTLHRLAQYAGIPLGELFTRMEKNNGNPSFKPVLLHSDADRNILAAIEARRFDLPGVFIDVKTRRQYLHRASAAHLLGYLGEVNSTELKSKKYPDLRFGDLIGKCGVEKAYDAVLRGKRGRRQVEVDASGQVMRVIRQADAVPGKNVFLTIDHRLQQLAETLLMDVAGAAVALDPKNGHVLVLASSPSFNPNAFVSGISHKDWQALISNPQRPMENKAIQAEYPPASTYKIITAIAGLEEGVIDENTTFFCPGHYRFGNRSYRCWKKGGHGHMNVEKALTESCDVFFYQVGQRLGVDRLAKWAMRFGFGAPTGIDLEHEAEGLIPTAAWKKEKTGIPWQKGETLSIAIGQGFNLVTPLQQAVMIAAVANGGIRYKPMLIQSIRSADGKEAVHLEKKDVDHIPL